jgi:hypothetical protein
VGTSKTALRERKAECLQVHRKNKELYSNAKRQEADNDVNKKDNRAGQYHKEVEEEDDNPARGDM